MMLKKNSGIAVTSRIIGDPGISLYPGQPVQPNAPVSHSRPRFRSAVAPDARSQIPVRLDCLASFVSIQTSHTHRLTSFDAGHD
jgi:hypothetical protein